MSDCGQFLGRLPHRLPDHYTFVCECCQRGWELRQRTRWLTYRPWVKTIEARDGSRVWVRLSKPLSLQVMAIQERQ